MERVAQAKKEWDELVESERRTFAQAIEEFRSAKKVQAKKVLLAT
jgi:hypothetical protein